MKNTRKRGRTADLVIKLLPAAVPHKAPTGRQLERELVNAMATIIALAMHRGTP